ncbi:HAMP domain-containing histidine kinase [Eubacterium limosum]|uniref:sensor histidine kinase n=1 Tax=Eubacterium limosum TaxID=1736 RepID=UPI001D085444|nr:HAMP domain-containing sensor histidine kinase [Eubacterium limosum]MCB6570572.1 HAMP domain-containing histidine kinase [Eubacterium limosum]
MRKILQRMTITKKFTLFYAVIFSVTLFLLSAGALYSVEFYQAYASHKDIEVVKNAIISQKLNQAEISETIKLSANKNINVLIKQSDKTIFKSEGFEYDFANDIPFNRVWSSDEDEEHYLAEKTQFDVDGVTYELYLVKNLYSEKNFLKILFVILAAIDALGMIISILLGYLFSKRMLKPIGIITKTAKSMSSNNLSVRIPLPESEDELYMLSKVFNDMADDLEISFQKQSQFVADASHELKSPISAIAGHVNLLSRWGKDDPKALEISVDAIQKEADYMSNLVSKLLFLAKLDAGKAVDKEEFNLSNLLNEMTQEMKVYNENHIVYCNCGENLVVFSDKAMVKQLIRIITDNAFQFTPPGGKITINAKKNDDAISLKITDTGCGMSEEIKAHIFDRFFTESLSRNKETSGNGLGLSIAKGICNMLNINITVQSELNHGSTFKLVFH